MPKCPVCKTECGEHNLCSYCGFTQVGREFINRDEATYWLETVVRPYVAEYLGKYSENFRFEGSVLQKVLNTKMDVLAIPEGVTEIAKGAFSTRLRPKKISIPSTVAIINDRCNLNTCNLESIEVHPLNKTYVSEGNCCIDKVHAAVVWGCRYSIIPEYITKVCQGAFRNSPKLPNNILGHGVVVIENKAFYMCEFDKLLIPASVQKIDSQAFRNCKLKHIEVDPANATFYSETDACIRKIDKTLVLGCENTIVPNNVEVIGEYSFFQCVDLKQILLPQKLVRIEKRAFNGCRKITNVTLPTTLVELGAYAFAGTGIQQIIIPGKTAVIQGGVFANCRRLMSIYVDRDNSTYYSMNNCCIEKSNNKLIAGCRKSVIPQNVSVIGEGALSYVTPDYLIKEVEYEINEQEISGVLSIPEHIQTIETDGFGMNSYLAVIIPRSVKQINEYGVGGIVFCEHKEKPKEWDTEWHEELLYDDYAAPYWLDEWEYDENDNPFPKELM